MNSAVQACGEEMLETEKTPKRQSRQDANSFLYGVLT
jgi:hypothetical protein